LLTHVSQRPVFVPVLTHTSVMYCEVLAHVRKHVMQGRTLDREAVVLELGDALWCLTIAADTLGVPLGDVAGRNVAKLRQRHPG